MNPITGQFLGPNSTASIGAIVPNTGDPLNGVFAAGQGITKTAFEWPALAFAPRFGMAYDVTGEQRVVVRGGAGLFFDRPSGNSVFAQVLNPPNLRNVTARNGQLSRSGASAVAARAERLRVRQRPAGVDSVEQRRADDAAVGDGARRLLRRPAPVRDPPEHGHQPDRLRRGVPAAEPGPDAGGEHDRLVGGRHRSDALVPRLRLDHADLGLAGADLPLAAAVAAAAVPQRPVVRVQRHHRPLRSPDHHAAAAARSRRQLLDPRRPGRGRQAARQQQSAGPHHQGQLRVGYAGRPRRHGADEGRRA